MRGGGKEEVRNSGGPLQEVLPELLPKEEQFGEGAQRQYQAGGIPELGWLAGVSGTGRLRGVGEAWRQVLGRWDFGPHTCSAGGGSVGHVVSSVMFQGSPDLEVGAGPRSRWGRRKLAGFWGEATLRRQRC